MFVFDLGGGTFDVTIMRIENHHIRMLASNGDHRLGGKDWDDVIVNWVAEEFDKLHGENPLLDLQSYQDLYNRALDREDPALQPRRGRRIVHSYNGKSVKLESDPRGLRTALPPPARKVQDDLRDRDAGSRACTGRRSTASCSPAA